MRIVAINEAEAIIEPFFDGGTSEPDNPDPRYRVLDEYQVQVLNGAIGSIRQGWAFATIQLDKAAGSLPALEMHRRIFPIMINSSFLEVCPKIFD